MVSTSRRRVLGLVAGSLGAVAGCSGITGDETETFAIHVAIIELRTEQKQTVQLQFIDGEEVVYWRSVTVPVADPDQYATGSAFAPGLPLSPGDYTLLAKVEGTSDWIRVDFENVSLDAEECFEVDVIVEADRTLSTLTSIDEAVCGKAKPTSATSAR